MLTFDKIRDIERAEKESKKLQKLPENFLSDLRDYLKKKEQLKSSADIHELENVRNIIRRFFESREKKLLEGALYTVRTGLQPENLTKEEQDLFYFLTDRIKNFRENFFSEIQKDKKLAYKVMKALPAFVGPDMKTYELKENEIISTDFLPKPLNDLLLKEGVIEQVEE
ncbi:MAG: DNA replication complex GINS family protein [Candidatus Aenigmarchaeota archaeon]|nr:DNA replication complex GINS family protein [Candidatus Aenigmarchaeota archaeon]